MKTFLIVFAPEYASRKQITDFLDQIGPAWDWHGSIPQCIFFTSPLTAHQLANMFEKQFGTGPGRFFLITEIPKDFTTREGRLPERGWRILNDPYNPRAQ